MAAKEKPTPEHTGATAPAEHRPPLDILYEIVGEIASHLGNPPRLEALLAELAEKL